MRSLHGMHVTGFPNLFIVGPQQQANLISNITHNQVEAARDDRRHPVRRTGSGAPPRVEVTPEAEAAWTEPIAEMERNFLGSPDCTPGLLQQRGWVPSDRRERLNGGRLPGAAPRPTSPTSTGGGAPATSPASTSAEDVRPRRPSPR